MATALDLGELSALLLGLRAAARLVSPLASQCLEGCSFFLAPRPVSRPGSCAEEPSVDEALRCTLLPDVHPSRMAVHSVKNMVGHRPLFTPRAVSPAPGFPRRAGLDCKAEAGCDLIMENLT